MIYHISLPEQWEESLRRGAHTAASLETEGFIHCSEQHQVERSLNRFYSNDPEVRVLTIDPELLACRLKYEPAHGEMFPHLYGELNLDAVVAVETLMRNGELFHYPVEPLLQRPYTEEGLR